MNNTTTTFTYGGDGLRNSRTMGGVTTTFTWDIAGGLPVVLDDGAQYVYGAGLVSQVSGANSYYYLADGLGSTMKTVDASGAVVNGYTYDIYGKKTSSTGSQANEFDFAGQQTDPTGLQYLRARYYDPETGGFTSREPMAIAPGWGGNGTSSAGANPTRYLDPSGLYLIEGGDSANSCRHECSVDFDFTGGAWEKGSGLGIGYIDLNFTFGGGIVGTVGVQISGTNPLTDVHIYIGVGVGVPGASVQIAPGDQSPTDGITCGVSGALPAGPLPVGPSGQVGLAGGSSGEKGDNTPNEPFYEVGVGTPGASATCSAVFTPADLGHRMWP